MTTRPQSYDIEATILWHPCRRPMALRLQPHATGKPAVTHTIVACPVSLVTNWESELTKKWLGASRLRQVTRE